MLAMGDPRKRPVSMDPTSIGDRIWVRDTPLMHKEEVGRNVGLLRFKLPEDVKNIFKTRGVPSTVKLKAAGMFKSYDPVTMPENSEYVDFIVKGYGVNEDGSKGLGQYLNDLEVGETVNFLVKPRKLFFGKPFGTNSWPWLSFICGGTGIAPFLQMSRYIFRNPEDVTKVFITYANRSEEDIICLQELLKLQEDFPDRPKKDPSTLPFKYSKGWVSKKDIEENVLQNLEEWNLNTDDGAHFVCGTRQFLDTVCGDKIKDEKGNKIYGPLRGILKELDFSENQVFKM
eukprot:snap_masked-scaffold_7-processed-gene-18.37-mRNA-1 protein AED:1.00 eAED:1.00 QI:0/0/0/0/1/1/2/0/285